MRLPDARLLLHLARDRRRAGDLEIDFDVAVAQNFRDPFLAL